MGKAFRALVALVRQVADFEQALLRNEQGADLMVTCLNPQEDTKTREKACSFVRSLACDGRLQEEDLVKLAPCVATLLRTCASENIQYRETLASCCYELATTFTSLCRNTEMLTLARARLDQLGAQASDEQETASL